MIFVVFAIPSAHRVGGHSIAYGTEQLVDGETCRFTENVPNGNIDQGHGYLRYPLYTLILECTPKVRTDTARESWIFADENGPDLTFEDRLHYAWATGHCGEVAVAPTGDAGVSEHTEDNTPRGGTEIVDCIPGEFRLRKTQQIGFNASDLVLLLRFLYFREGATQGTPSRKAEQVTSSDSHRCSVSRHRWRRFRNQQLWVR